MRDKNLDDYPYYKGHIDGKKLGEKIGYIKAIDEFKRELITHFADWQLTVAPFVDEPYGKDKTRIIEYETIEHAVAAVIEIAESKLRSYCISIED